ncbi:MAG TPA: hypothetical protein VHB98_15065 [Chloroflexota bacterium]|nr:hypothetical protein [Chloroflexota bacterium]
MNDFPYGTPAAGGFEGGVSAPHSASPTVNASSAHELAQLVAMEMQRDIDTRIEWSLQQRQPAHRVIAPQELGLILGSIGIAVPLTAIAGALAGLPGIIIVWLGLVLINAAWAIRR